MKVLLIEAFLDAVDGIRAAVKLFWPIWGIMALGIVLVASFGNLRVSGNFKEAPLVSLAMFAAALSILAYIFVIFCQGAVGWHRRLLLNEKARWTSPIPARRSLQYALPAFVFALAIWIGMVVFTSLVLPVLVSLFAASFQGLTPTANSSLEDLDAYRKATTPLRLAIQAGMILIGWAVIWFCRSWLMAFPHIAVRTVLPAWGNIRKAIKVPPGLVGALLVTMFLPSVLGTLYQSFMPASLQLSLIAAITVTVVNFGLSILSLLCGLSLFSIAYRHAGIEQIPYQEVKDAAQA